MTSVDRAYAHCQRLASSHYENFPTASFLLPGRIRPAVAAVYAFARIGDDFADEMDAAEAAEAASRPRGSAMPGAERRIARLRDWQARLARAAGGAPDPDDLVFVALADAIRRFDLPVESLHALTEAFLQDVTTPRYSTIDAVLDYCTRSADPVGRLVLALHDVRDAASLAESDRICTALQLANFWQDVAVDAAKDRVYLPLDDMARHGVAEDDLFARRATPGFRALLRHEVGLTRAIFAQGWPLVARTRGRLGLWLRLVWSGGHRILDAVEAQGFDTLTRRPTVGRADWAVLAARALVGPLALPARPVALASTRAAS